uniref:Uncharacterized protein n=1 Tax=viral metagenome TaxID=1070528 RepID=A0A6C0CZU7_9ZZZZ
MLTNGNENDNIYFLLFTYINIINKYDFMLTYSHKNI